MPLVWVLVVLMSLATGLPTDLIADIAAALCGDPAAAHDTGLAVDAVADLLLLIGMMPHGCVQGAAPRAVQ